MENIFCQLLELLVHRKAVFCVPLWFLQVSFAFDLLSITPTLFVLGDLFNIAALLQLFPLPPFLHCGLCVYI